MTKTDHEITKHRLTFHFSGKMARLLGRESVSSDVAALFELVKNGYDADASKIKVSFENMLSNGGKDGKITVEEEEGDGMTYEEIEDNWMVIGTDVKNKHPITKRKHRTVVGNKGIGRFATEKLATKVIMISRPINHKEEIKVTIDWNAYEKEGVTFDEVKNTVEVIHKRENVKKSGVNIILTGLRERWNVEKIEKLKTSIGSIILPPELSQVTNDPFTVEIYSPEFETEEMTKVQSLLFKLAPYKLKAVIAENRSDYKVTIIRLGKIIREERGELQDTMLDNGEFWKPFGKCKLTLYFFPWKTRYDDWDKYYLKAMRINDIRKTIRKLHGVKLYRDNFWVRPYGDIGNDWLSLEEERVQANYKIGNSQVIGFVEISKKHNSEIIDTTTRERLVENTEFHSMRKFVKDAIGVLNDYRYSENRKLKEQKIQLEHQNIIESEVKYLQSLLEENLDIPVKEKKEIKTSLQKIENVFADFKGEVDEDIENLENSERAYRNLASLGISSATTAHEIAHIMSTLGEIPQTIINKLKKEPKSLELVKTDVFRAVDKINSIKHFMTFINQFVKNLVNDNEVKHEKEIIHIGSILNELFDGFRDMLKSQHIELQQKLAPERVSVYMNRADFESIILNLFTNSLKVLGKMPENKKKIIKITVHKDEKTFRLKFSDNGPGISDNNKPKIFRLFFTTYQNGTGLGLPIVKEIVEEYGGKIEINAESEIGNGATFEITIPTSGVKK